MLKVEMKSIKQSEQRYETLGDWWDDENGVTQIRVTGLKIPESEFLVCLHELVEQYLCKKRGISEESVSDHDKMFEKERSDGKWDEYAEPGDDPRAPYRKEHFVAEIIERIMASELGINWKEHCEFQQFGND